jgi:hypothetical protein
VGHALRIAAEVIGGAEGLKLLEEAVTHLEASPAAHELATVLVAHGAALRAAGVPGEAAGLLRRGLAEALRGGADGLARRARRELAPIAHAGPETRVAGSRRKAHRAPQGVTPGSP